VNEWNSFGFGYEYFEFEAIKLKISQLGIGLHCHNIFLNGKRSLFLHKKPDFINQKYKLLFSFFSSFLFKLCSF